MRLKLNLLFSLLFFLVHSLVAQSNISSEREELKGEILIDFSTLGGEKNLQTEIDFSDLAPLYGLTEEEKGKMKVDLSLKHWQLFVPPSALPYSYNYPSFIAPAQVRGGSPLFSGELILGARLMFPLGRRETYILYPPFPIPFQAGEKGDQFLNRGMIRRVGAIKEIQIEVYSEYSDVKITLNLENDKGKVISIPFENLNFGGWRRLVWLNPNYKKDSSLLTKGLASQSSLSGGYRLKSLSFTHSSHSSESGVLVFIRNIKVLYDKLEEDFSLEGENEIILKDYSYPLDKSNIPYYKRYIMENYLIKKKSSVLKNNDSFVNRENS